MKLQVDGRSANAYTGGKPFDPALPCIVFVHLSLIHISEPTRPY